MNYYLHLNDKNINLNLFKIAYFKNSTKQNSKKIKQSSKSYLIRNISSISSG